MSELKESFESVSFEATQVVDTPAGELLVLIHVRGRGRGSSVEVENDIAWIITLRGGKASRIVVYEDPAAAR
jgi:ketosteroid isomerase-like protein